MPKAGLPVRRSFCRLQHLCAVRLGHAERFSGQALAEHGSSTALPGPQERMNAEISTIRLHLRGVSGSGGAILCQPPQAGITTRSTMPYRTIIAVVSIAFLFGACTFPGSCLMDYREYSLTLWKVDVRSGQRQLVSAAWPISLSGAFSIQYDLLYVDPGRAQVYYALRHSVREPGLYALDLVLQPQLR